MTVRDLPEEPKDEQLRRIFAELGLITASDRITSVLRQARRAARVSDITVLLEGETGTGKGVLARAIHKLDQKRNAFPFVTMHCSSVSESLAESELFGHQRGAFSGAISDRHGLFRAANRGTFFLDDINDLPIQLQPKLLDVLQRRVVRSVGSDQETAVDVRLIAASNQPLSRLVEQGRFRSDLYYRLTVVKLVLPPLRERPEDLSELLSTMAHRHAALYHHVDRIDPELVHLLESKPFLGNVRELESLVKRMLFLKDQGSSLDLADWYAQADQSDSGTRQDPVKEAADALWKIISEHEVSYTQALRDIEKKVLEIAMHGNLQRRQVARRLRTSERSLYYKMRLHGLGGRVEK